jgi:hypothetical protein
MHRHCMHWFRASPQPWLNGGRHTTFSPDKR